MKNYSMKNTGILSLTLSMFIFGTIGIFVRYISLPSGFLAMSRGILGTLFLLAVVFIRKNRLSKEAIKNNLVVLILSGAFIGINWILLFEAYKYTTVACATLCYYLSPVFVIIASIFVLSEKLTAKKILCVISALAGIVLVSGVLESDLGDIRGILLGIGAAVFYASVVLLNKKLKNISSYDTTVIQLSSAAVVILPYTLICEDISLKAFDMKAIIMLIIVGTVHTGLSYML
ncbi:MAG: EamA family transporter, partial [Clostridia bacterium]|nr:EamA family transporter [Clostridia bacterium]